MATCEDFPCCGHELNCCPDFDPETGEQLNMKCVCGATVPLDSPTSLCGECYRDSLDEIDGGPDYGDRDDDLDADCGKSIPFLDDED